MPHKTNQRHHYQSKENDKSAKAEETYIPPARLRAMQEKIKDRNGIRYQRLAWEALKKSIKGPINKVNVSNVYEVCRELLRENVIRGRGILAKSLVRAQTKSLTFTRVFAALAAVVNSKFPQVGLLLSNRLVGQFKRGFKRNIKHLCLSSTAFLAHLYNQKVVDEVIVLEILILLLEKPTNDSVEVVVDFLKLCGRKLSEDSSHAVVEVYNSLRNVLNESTVETRVAYMIEVLFAVAKDGYKDYPVVLPELDLIEEEDQFTHRLNLEDEPDMEERLDIFKFDADYEKNEKKYEEIVNELFGEDPVEYDDEEEDMEDEEGIEEEEKEKRSRDGVIVDMTEANLVILRKTIYLTIQSSLSFEECVHKLLKMQLKPGQESELCGMIVDCTAQERTYRSFYGLLAGRFCALDTKYVSPFETTFILQYEGAHRLETEKIRNMAKLFAHLLQTDAISWQVFRAVKINEDDTTSSGRIFLKILFQELAEGMGIRRLNERMKDPTLCSDFDGVFPMSNARDTRFSINFFTSIGLGGLTDAMREHLKATPASLRKARSLSSSSSSSSSSSDSDPN